MTYSDQYNFIYLAVPKTGSRSIQEYLQKYGIRSAKGWDPNHDTYEIVKKKLGEEKCKKYFKFSFFRNPWSMLISAFFFNKHRHNFPTGKNGVIEWLNYYRGGDPYVPYIFDENDHVILDFIGKIEHLQEDFKTICNKINIPYPENVPHLGKQVFGERLHYTEYYEDPKLRDKIRLMFSKSLSVLNYEFDDADR